MATMYRLPPIIPANMEFDLPTRMYQLPVIQKCTMENSTGNSDVDSAALQALEQRQEAILNQLQALRLEVDKLKGCKTAPCVSKSASAKDIVIRADPAYAPVTLPILCTRLQQTLSVFTNCHIHSSVTKGLPNKLEDFLPASNCDSRSKADLCLTLIWKNVGKDAELVTSPTSSALIKGEVNLLRYFSRRFDLFNITDPIGQAQADATVDSFYAELNWGTGNLSRLVGSTLEPALKQSPYLCKSGLSIADVYAFALLAQDKNGKKSPAVQDWMKRCDQAIQKCQG